jgi:hypothetical protein
MGKGARGARDWAWSKGEKRRSVVKRARVGFRRREFIGGQFNAFRGRGAVKSLESGVERLAKGGGSKKKAAAPESDGQLWGGRWLEVELGGELGVPVPGLVSQDVRV